MLWRYLYLAGATKRLLTNLRSELEVLKRRVLDDLDKRNEAAREANKGDSTETAAVKRVPGLQHVEGNRGLNGPGKNERDFTGTEEIRQTNNNVRDFTGIEERFGDAKGLRGLEELEILGRNERDFTGIEERKQGVLKEKRQEGKTEKDEIHKLCNVHL